MRKETSRGERKVSTHDSLLPLVDLSLIKCTTCTDGECGSYRFYSLLTNLEAFVLTNGCRRSRQNTKQKMKWNLKLSTYMNIFLIKLTIVLNFLDRLNSWLHYERDKGWRADWIWTLWNSAPLLDAYLTNICAHPGCAFKIW